MSFATLLGGVNQVRGVRGSMVVAAEDGLMVESELMFGVPGPAVAALVASLFQRAQRSVAGARLGHSRFLQLEADEGYLFAAAPAGDGELLLVVVAERWVNVGMVRLALAKVVEKLA
jgi:predicted regulator of Ras-like GTPase activity (Roadblock/LC7/MglB family)